MVDLEDAHLGDPGEDFGWQVLAGTQSVEHAAMASAYGAVGGSLGANGAERLALMGAEPCLDVLGWDLGESETTRRYHDRCVATIDELLAGRLPTAPGE